MICIFITVILLILTCVTMSSHRDELNEINDVLIVEPTINNNPITSANVYFIPQSNANVHTASVVQAPQATPIKGEIISYNNQNTPIAQMAHPYEPPSYNNKV